jgi:hypothetical protein
MTRHRRGWLWYLGFVLLALTTLFIGTSGALGLHFQANPALLWIALWSAAAEPALKAGYPAAGRLLPDRQRHRGGPLPAPPRCVDAVAAAVGKPLDEAAPSSAR